MKPGDKGNDIHEKFSRTELYRKEKLMRQFLKHDVALFNSELYKQNYDLIDWSKK